MVPQGVGHWPQLAPPFVVNPQTVPRLKGALGVGVGARGGWGEHLRGGGFWKMFGWRAGGVRHFGGRGEGCICNFGGFWGGVAEKFG